MKTTTTTTKKTSSLFHLRVMYVAVQDDVEDQILQEAEGYTHAITEQQAAYNIARKNNISTISKHYRECDHVFKWERIEDPLPEEDGGEDKEDREEDGREYHFEQISIFDDLDDI